MKRLRTKVLAILTLSVTAVLTGYATTKTPAKKPNTAHSNMLSIVGNPIGRKDNYTINATKEMSIKIHCAFVNTGSKAAELNIWRTPSATTPQSTVHLRAGKKHKPFQLVKRFTLNLEPHWWCRIYTPHGESNRWRYCSYFSISDATITEHNPFSTWNKTIHSRDTSYHCRIEKPRGKVRFFYFK